MKYCRVLALSFFCFALGCRSHPVIEPDRPQLTPNVRMIDATLQSSALHREMAFRLIIPQQQPREKEPVVYLLHGAGVNYHDWTNYSQIASFAAHGIVLVLPNMPNAYYINQANSVADEDFLIKELIPEVHRLEPGLSTVRDRTAIVGISRGGYGAVTVGLGHPEIFGFVGGLSPALDFAERGFRWHDPLASLESRRVFGPRGSETRKNSDPYLLVGHLSTQNAPALFLACGDREALAPVAKRFVSVAERHKVQVEFHMLPGKHDWGTWNAALPFLEASLLKSFGKASMAVAKP